MSSVWDSVVTDRQRGPNRDCLLRRARLLRPLIGELLFVGGQVAEPLARLCGRLCGPALSRISGRDRRNTREL